MNHGDSFRVIGLTPPPELCQALRLSHLVSAMPSGLSAMSCPRHRLRCRQLGICIHYWSAAKVCSGNEHARCQIGIFQVKRYQCELGGGLAGGLGWLIDPCCFGQG